MEEVDVKEFHSVSAPAVQFANGMSWSEDHKVSFITTSTLQIMEVASSPSISSAEMCLKKSIIKPSEDAPTANAGIDVNRVLYQLDQRDVYRMLLDMKLAPYLPDAKPPDARFVSAQWSQISMYEDHRCMIATLTGTGCLKLYAPHFTCWIEVTDLSTCWVNHCKSLWSENLSSEKDITILFTILQRRTSELKITAMVWGNLVVESEKNRFSHMATISHSGRIALWKLDNLAKLENSKENYKPIILTTCETNLYNACALHWIQWNKDIISVIAGDMNGCVKVVTFSLHYSDNATSMLYIKDMWKEKDHMQVSCIKNLPLSALCNDNQRILAVTKNSYIIVFLISQEDVMSHCHDHIGGLPITGLEVINNQTFITCTLSGCLCKYSVDVQDNKLSMSSKILTSNLSWQDVACFGIAKTQNSKIWTLCTNLCKMYDHLVVRRPSQLVFINICGSENSCNQINMMESLLVSPKLRFHWENLEVFRVNYLKQLKAQPLEGLEFSQNLEILSTAQLQLELWRARIVVNHVATTDVVVRNPEACAYVTLLEELIMCRHACKHICRLTEKHKECPLETNLHTMGLLRIWLQTWLSHNKPVNNTSEKNNEKKELSPDTADVQPSDSVGNIEVENSENTPMSETPTLITSVTNGSEKVVDDEAASVGSFDDAISTDSNSSSAISDKTVVSKQIRIQHGRIPSSFLKYKLNATYEQVTSVLALPIIRDTLDTELCAFCEQEVQMDIDWRSGSCSLSHRLPRCCQCLSQCHQIPYRICTVCPTVACMDIHCDMEPFCIFCDSPLIVDEKFKKTEFSSPPEKTEPKPEEESQADPEKMEIQAEGTERVLAKAKSVTDHSEVSMEVDT